ncbi:alpha/beta hydrolase [uncultured Corynebacterium sp.]|uniref:alpha/beta hydrolase n=1 Tax=uncultured Corynebacterium sp. TaxID=159447 RepID=UPI0025D9C098|nr:alpha/beta hydrolase [uncultured Corynebacterium sp.]
MSEPISGFDARPDYDPTDEGFTPVTTDEGKLGQLVDYLEEHVSAFADAPPTPWDGAPEDIAAARAAANDRMARRPDAIVHASMLVLGAGVDHTLPFVAFDGASCRIADHDADGVPVRVFVPRDPTGAVVVGAHGGAWWMGDGAGRDNTFGPECAALAQRSGAVVVDVDVRLAPEHPMPAAAEDLAAAVRWVRTGPLPEIAADAPVVLWGESSGGHTAVVAAKLLHDAGAAVDSVALTAPALDLRGRAPEELAAVFGHNDAADPDVSPALGDVSWLPRVHVQLGTKDDSVAGGDVVVDKLRDAGRPATSSEFLATHLVAVPAVQRARITDLARHILDATGTERELPGDPAGDYDKDAIDRANREAWGS